MDHSLSVWKWTINSYKRFDLQEKDESCVMNSIQRMTNPYKRNVKKNFFSIDY